MYHKYSYNFSEITNVKALVVCVVHSNRRPLLQSIRCKTFGHNSDNKKLTFYLYGIF